jgi:hypothetical protein
MKCAFTHCTCSCTVYIFWFLPVLFIPVFSNKILHYSNLFMCSILHLTKIWEVYCLHWNFKGVLHTTSRAVMSIGCFIYNHRSEELWASVLLEEKCEPPADPNSHCCINSINNLDSHCCLGGKTDGTLDLGEKFGGFPKCFAVPGGGIAPWHVKLVGGQPWVF